MVAYAALQVFPSHFPESIFDPLFLQTYVGLSSVSWGDKDGTFSLIHFYHLIVKTLSNNEDQWVVDTLDWWQRYVHSGLHSIYAFSHCTLQEAVW
jgi:hypothetical protein